MPSRNTNRRNKSDSVHVQKKWKNKHSPHTNKNRIKQRICYKNAYTINTNLAAESLEISPNPSPNELEVDNSGFNAYMDQYQDIPIWHCPICSYKNIEKHLFCSICSHPYSRKSQEITISKYIKYTNCRTFKNNKKQKTILLNKISPACFKKIISAKTGLPHNKIEVNPLLNEHAMPRLLRKYYQRQNEISLVYMTQEIIPDYNHEFADRWQCQFCGKRNPKIYVFCERCFLTPRPDIVHKPPAANVINPFLKEAALNDAIIQFCGLRTVVYGYCEIYSAHILPADIIDLVAAYYQLYKADVPIGDILPFNQHDLSQCNDFDVYVTKRNKRITCHCIESLDLYIGNMNKWRRKHKNIYICLLLVKKGNFWPQDTVFQHLLPIYNAKVKGIQYYGHQFSDSKRLLWR